MRFFIHRYRFNLVVIFGFFAAIGLWISTSRGSSVAGIILVTCVDIDAGFVGFHNFVASAHARGYALSVLPWQHTWKLPWLSRVQEFLRVVSSADNDEDVFVVADALDVLAAPVHASSVLARFRTQGLDAWFAAESLCDSAACRRSSDPLSSVSPFAFLNGGAMLGTRRGLGAMLRCAQNEMLSRPALDDQAAFVLCFRKGPPQQLCWGLDSDSLFFGVVSSNARQLLRDWTPCLPADGCWWRRSLDLASQPAFFHFPGMGFRKAPGQLMTHCQAFLVDKYNDLGRRHVPSFVPIGDDVVVIGRKNHLMLDPASPQCPCNPQTMAGHTLRPGDEILLGEMLVSSPLLSSPEETLWSGGAAAASSFVSLQYDGNLVRYAGKPDNPGNVLWASNTDSKCPPKALASFRLDDNGSFGLFCNDTPTIWLVQAKAKAQIILGMRFEMKKI